MSRRSRTRRRPATGALIFGGIVVAAAVALWAIFVRPPEIARGLPSNIRQARAAFTQRVLDAFPPGTEHAVIVEGLSAQGFKISERDAVFRAGTTSHSGACKFTYLVTWRRTPNGLIEDVAGDRLSGCL